jgi:hypothetical protein
MSGQSIRFATKVLLFVATMLLPTSPILAGGRVSSGTGWWSTPRPSVSPAVAPSVRPASSPLTVSVVVTPPPRPVAEPLAVDIRSPDGEVRRYPVEGGRAAIQSGQVVLRPGESVTIQWRAGK